MPNKIKTKILLIEDDPFLIDIYTTKLQEKGFEVVVAINGEEALSKINEENLDLALLDIVLPQFDGWEVLQKIKSNPKSKDLKVIILSNLGQREEVEKGLSLGAIKYLIKAHYTASEVVEEINKILKI